MTMHFLKDSKFIYGEEISVADLEALCELTQSWMADEHFEDDYIPQPEALGT